MCGANADAKPYPEPDTEPDTVTNTDDPNTDAKPNT